MIGVAPRTAPNRRLVPFQTLTVALLVCGYAGYYLCRSDLSVCMPLIIRDLTRAGISADVWRIRLGTVASLGVLAYAVGKFPSGSMADFLGGRRNFLMGMAGSIGFTALFALSGTLPLFTLAWMGNRLVQSLGWAGMVKISSRWFSFERYGTVMGIISLSYLFGDAVARQFMAMLVAAGLGWRGVFAIAALVLGALLLICGTLLRESPRDIGEQEPDVNPDNLFQSCGAADRPDSLGSLLRPLLKSGVFWLACLLSLGTTILRETFGLWTPTWFAQSAAMTVAEAASASAWFPFAGGMSVILCGCLSDRLGRSGRALLLVAGLGLSTVVLLAPALNVLHGSRPGTVIVSALIAFLIIGPYSFLGGAIALDFGGRRGSATASGIIDGIGYLGGIISGDTMARISVAFGWSGAFLVLSAVALLSTAAGGVFLREERKTCQ